MRIYIAGPMTGIPAYNFPAFHAAAARLRALGHEVYSPAEWDEAHGFDATGLTGHEDLTTLGFDLREALATDLDWICRHAELVVVLPGFTESLGAKAEVAVAFALRIRVCSEYGIEP